MVSTTVSGSYLVSETTQIAGFINSQLSGIISSSAANIFVIPDAGNMKVNIGVTKY